jgi:transcriptional regulator with XRE-family HTH domain
LEDIREAKQTTKAEVARRLGVKRPVVSRLLTGKGTVPLGTIADVAEALDVYIDVRIKPQPRSGKRYAAIEVHEAAA